MINVLPEILQSSAASPIVSGLLNCLASSAQKRNALLLQVIETILNNLSDGEVYQQSVAQIVQVVNNTIKELKSDDLAKLTQHMLGLIKAGKDLKGM